eukprot:TRINITY_DN32824_c0_g1_i2.p1 TRINITY_DN32824_c0_g1~~TRINITY_DN32824_c0_g1_i2.p1  ORF type:complete len:236 (+),score=28.15 TRINITY_DN32824_c0_g1_i2:111-818(+)
MCIRDSTCPYCRLPPAPKPNQCEDCMAILPHKYSTRCLQCGHTQRGHTPEKSPEVPPLQLDEDNTTRLLQAAMSARSEPPSSPARFCGPLMRTAFQGPPLEQDVYGPAPRSRRHRPRMPEWARAAVHEGATQGTHRSSRKALGCNPASQRLSLHLGLPVSTVLRSPDEVLRLLADRLPQVRSKRCTRFHPEINATVPYCSGSVLSHSARALIVRADRRSQVPTMLQPLPAMSNRI